MGSVLIIVIVLFCSEAVLSKSIILATVEGRHS